MGRGSYYDLVEGLDGKLNTVETRADAKEILSEMGRSLDHMEKRIANLEEENRRLRSESYKDEELRKMKTELDRMKEESAFGFPVSKKEHEMITEFRRAWNEQHPGRMKTKIGITGAGWHYVFTPTPLGVSGVIVAPDGQKLEFQEIG